METGILQTEPPGSRRRVVLRSNGRRHQLTVSESETGDSASEPENVNLERTTHYDMSTWEANSLPVSTNRKLSSHFESEGTGVHLGQEGGELLEGISVTADAFREKLKLSGGGVQLHSTPAHSHSRFHQPVSRKHHPAHQKHPSETTSSSSECDCDNDAVFLSRPRTAPPVDWRIHPNSSPKDNSLSSGLHPPPSRCSGRPRTSHSRSSADSISPLHIKSKQPPPKGKGRGRRNQVHPAPSRSPSEPRQPPASFFSPTHSSNLKGTSSPNSSFNKRLFSTDSTISSAVAPLLTTSLRKGSCTQPSLDVSWDFDGERCLESHFPDRHVQVFVVTWNMQELKELPDSLDDLLLPLSHETAADVYVIGTQESTPARREWEFLIQQTLGPNHVLVSSSSLGILYLHLFLRRDLLWYCSAVRSASYATRPVTPIKTKGGVGLSFSLFGSSFLFITSHFTANQQKVWERNSDMQRIATNLELSTEPGVVTDLFDHVFWLGDLNYRVELERSTADSYLESTDWLSLLLQDQLTKEILQGNVFEGFSEQPIAFPPSYKFDLNSDTYDSSEKRRIPSWTDRILFKSQGGSGITGCGYNSCRTLQCSDHRPVYAVFKVKLEPSSDVDGVPDTVVTFDREIYVKALRQRKLLARLSVSARRDEPDGPAPSHSRHQTSSVCSIL